MTEQPIQPTRIIPPGATLPALPERPPAADEMPPWRAPAPAPPAPPAPPAEPEPWDWSDGPEPPREVVHRVRVELVHPEPEEQPGLWSRAWAWVTSRVRAWQLAVALLGALVPMPWTGYSVAATWAYCVGEARDISLWFGYGLGFGCFLLTAVRFTRTRGLPALFALVVTFIGLTGALHWYDPITALTGVKP